MKSIYLELPPTIVHTHKLGLCPTYSPHVQNSILLQKSAENDINLMEHYTMAVKES